MLTKTEKKARSFVQHYNEKKYWKYRNDVIKYSEDAKTFFKWCIYLKLFYIKRCDAFNNSSLGTHVGYGADFSSIPIFPHGLNGIIVSHNAKIGKNCTIYHQVTIGEGKNGAPIIKDNVTIYPGAKIFGKIIIGKNVKIGANCIVYKDVPDNSYVYSEGTKVISILNKKL